MKVVYHPAVQRDVSSILRHFDGINDRLGDDPSTKAETKGCFMAFSAGRRKQHASGVRPHSF